MMVELSMSKESLNSFKFYKIVLTGGPCGGKTTGQARLSTFFENLGWKVYRAPESASIYLSGGVRFSELNRDQAFKFQENIMRTMMVLEETYCHISSQRQQHTLLICDRGIMDGASYLPKEDWIRMKEINKWHDADLRDNRYDQVIHMVSAAKGAEAFYSLAGHQTRHEDLEEAKTQDTLTANAWLGHPHFDVIDNSTDFETKLSRLIAAVCRRADIDPGDRLAADSIKRKFLVTTFGSDETFPHYQEFTVIHDYLVTPHRVMQARVRKRGKPDDWTYTHTIRRPNINNQSVELRMSVTEKDYQILLAQKDVRHYTVIKSRRCFLWNNQYFQLDIYHQPETLRAQGLMILQIFTTNKGKFVPPPFLTCNQEVTMDADYTTFSLSLKEEYAQDLSFNIALSGDDSWG